VVRGDDPYRHNRFDRLFNGQRGRDDFLSGEEEENPLRRHKGRRDENCHSCRLSGVGKFIGDKSEDETSLLRELDKDGLAKSPFLCGGEGIGQLFRCEVDILYDRDIGKEAVSPGDQPPAQDIGGDHTQHIEKEEEDDDPKTWDGELEVKEELGHPWSQRAEEVIERVEDEFEDEKSDPERKDHQNTCKDLCPEMFEDVLHHRLPNEKEGGCSSNPLP